MRASRIGLLACPCLVFGIAFAQHRLHPPHPFGAPPQVVTLVGGLSPFTPGCNGTQPTGTNQRNAPDEPYVAVDPRNPLHLVAAWQQDRWTDGGASGLGSAVSIDGGRTWTRSLAPFSVCSGGTYLRASDPWVTISPDGSAYEIALAFDKIVNGTPVPSAVLVSRSADGGFTWGDPTTLVRTDSGGDDKEMIIADPNDARYAYAVWDRGLTDRIPAFFSRTADGGATWDPARAIFDPGTRAYATADQLAVLPDGTVLNMFVQSFATSPGAHNVVIRSTDHGLNWSAPLTISTNETIGTVDSKTQLGLRTGAGIPSIAVDPVSGTIYAVWSDARFSAHQRDGIVLTKSIDGGQTWAAPVQVNQAPNVQAFTPAVSVAASGTVAVTYYDFRQDTGDRGTLFANLWRITSHDGGATWHEILVAGPFDLLSAPRAAGAPFLGDYQGLTAVGNSFLAFFVAANTGNAANPSSVFASSIEREGDTRSNLRTEVNLHPKPFHAGDEQEPPRRK